MDWHTMGEGFTWDTQDLERDTATAQDGIRQGARNARKAATTTWSCLDEINIALHFDYLSEAAVIEGLEERSQRTSVILDGPRCQTGALPPH